METHVKVLAVLYIVLSGIGALFALMFLFGGAMIAGLVGATGQTPDAVMVAPWIGLAGGVLGTFFLILAVPGIITGVGLLKFRPWARILGIVLAVINLIHFPIGTAIGVYALWVLLTKETEALFRARAATGTPTTPPPTV